MYLKMISIVSIWLFKQIKDAMSDMLDALAGSPEEPYYGGLCSPCPAGPAISRELQKIGLEVPVMISRSAYFAPGSRAWAGDMVMLAGDGNDLCFGQVNFFAQCGDRQMCCVAEWQPMGSNQFRKSDRSILADLRDVADVCIYCEGDCNGTRKIVPETTWSGLDASLP